MYHLLTENRLAILVGVLILSLQGGILFFFGQPSICTCGYVKIWEGIVTSAGTSQHLTDWYTFSHIIHGFIFYLLLTLTFPKMSVEWRLALAIGIESAWEIAENTPTVIEHYRQQALARGYVGDSIINSLFDTGAMILGFVVARKAPIITTILIALVFELGTLYFIRDNLTLNVVNLIHPVEFIHSWQAKMLQ